MVSKKSRSEVRVNKHRRLRNRFSGTAERPRLACLLYTSTAEFGSSEGVIEEQIAWGKAGTPKRGDELILFEVTFCAGKGQDREAVTRAHALCDEFVQQYRECLKKLRGEQCTERREFYDIDVYKRQIQGQA